MFNNIAMCFDVCTVHLVFEGWSVYLWFTGHVLSVVKYLCVSVKQML